MRSLRFVLLILLLNLIQGYVYGETSLLQERLIALVPGIGTYDLSSGPIIVGSEQISTGDDILLRGIDYRIDYRKGQLTILKDLTAVYISVSFILVPEDLNNSRFLYETKAETDSVFRSIQATKRSSWWQDDGKLLISGSKTFAVSFSDEQAFDLKQSLYVNLSGELAEGVNISAQLSDSQSKLSPEGDSRELSSLDQVFIKVYGKRWELAMGDIELKYLGSRYMDYSSRFEGINATIGSDSYLQAAYSAGGGKPSRIDITVIDGKQGPYYLNPGGQPGSLIVVPGSENVYRNGTRLERGADYIIDYSEGTLMFRILVYATDTISAWFSYSDENYPRHSILSSSNLSITPRWQVSHRVISASDAKDNPLLFQFSPADLDSLQAAGDSDAWGSGATLVEAGQGLYRLLSTPGGISYYQYAESDSLANYLVIFSYVGPQLGDYEQFSSGKYRYLGPGLGEWLPQKRLVSPNSSVNASLRSAYSYGSWDLGAEAVLAVNDANTLSGLDDDDNQGGYLYSWLNYKNARSRWRPELLLDYEKRWAHSVLLSDFSASISDYDLGSAVVPDSLELDSYGLKLGVNLGKSFTSELSVRHLRSDDDLEQSILRFRSSSPAWGLFPRLDIRSTLARTSASLEGLGTGDSNYLFIDGAWSAAWVKWGGLINLQENADISQDLKTSFLRLNPYGEIGNSKSVQTRLAFSADQNKIVDHSVSNSQSSQTWSFKQLVNTTNHNLNLDYNHRRLNLAADSTRTSYDLINLRANDSFLKRAITLISNYQLNQTEFFPRIRELQYVGSGLGVYDSTGVAVPEGDWDYEYITSSTGTMSSERNAQASIYLKPGNLWENDILRRINTDIVISGTEQQEGRQTDLLSYLFWPGRVFNLENTIYGRQSFQQNIWLELRRNKIIAQLVLDLERSLDNRYQDLSRTYRRSGALKLDFNRVGPYSFSITADNKRDSDSRYHSDVNNFALSSFAQRELGKNSILRLDLRYFEEQGSSQLNSDSYGLYGVALSPSFRSVWGSKGRLSGGLNLQYNQREGDDLLSFLPEKRGGAIIGLNLSAIYRLNAFSTGNIDYTATSYPGEDISHTLRIEFKAEL